MSAPIVSSTDSNDRRRIAIVFPADPAQGLATDLMKSRFVGVAKAMDAGGLDVIGAPYADAFVEVVRAQLMKVDVALVWLNPVEGGRDRKVLNALLREVASRGVVVSAHPDVIDRMGTKEVLLRTRSMKWGCDTRHYASTNEMASGLNNALALGGARVVKQMRGQSGDGVWMVRLSDAKQGPNTNTAASPVLVRHAKRGSVEEQMALQDFIAKCAPYFAAGGMIDQPYQARLPEGMIRCYVVGDRVAGFGEQMVNALYPAPAGAPASEAPQPGPRLYYPPTRPDFQALKHKLENEWIGELCHCVGIARSELPILWDADFLYGPKDASGADSYVLCEINVSSVYPFPESAMTPLVERVSAIVRVKEPK